MARTLNPEELAEAVRQRRQRAIYGRVGPDVPQVSEPEIMNYRPDTRSVGGGPSPSNVPKPIPGAKSKPYVEKLRRQMGIEGRQWGGTALEDFLAKKRTAEGERPRPDTEGVPGPVGDAAIKAPGRPLLPQPALEGEVLPRGVQPVKAPGGDVLGYKFNVPQDQQAEFGKAIYSDYAAGATPEGFRESEVPYGVSGVEPPSPLETIARDLVAGEAGDLAAAQRYYSMPEKKRGKPTAPVKRAMAGGLRPSQELRMAGQGGLQALAAAKPERYGKLLEQMQGVAEGRRKAEREDLSDSLAVSRELREQEKAGRAAQEDYVKDAEALTPEITSSVPWLMDNPTTFFQQAEEAGSGNPRQALNLLAGAQQEVAKQDSPLLTVAGQPITGKQAVAILNGEKPLDSWFSGPGDRFYDTARQQIAAMLQQLALEGLRR